MSEKITAGDAVEGQEYTTGGRSTVTAGELVDGPDDTQLRRIVNEHGVHTDVALDYPLWAIEDPSVAVGLVGLPESALRPRLDDLTDDQLTELVDQDGRTWLVQYQLDRFGREVWMPSQGSAPPAPAGDASGECSVCGKSQKLRPKHGTEDVLVLVAHNSAPGSYCLGGGEVPAAVTVTGTVRAGGRVVAEVEISDGDSAADVAAALAAASGGELSADGATVTHHGPVVVDARDIMARPMAPSAAPDLIVIDDPGPGPEAPSCGHSEIQHDCDTCGLPSEPEAPAWLLVREFDDTTETAADIEVRDRVADIMADAAARGVADTGAVVASINAALPEGYTAAAEGNTIWLEGPPRNPWADATTGAERIAVVKGYWTADQVDAAIDLAEAEDVTLQADVMREVLRHKAALAKVQQILDNGPKTDKGKISRLRGRMEQQTTQKRPGVMVACRIALDGLGERVPCDGNHPAPMCASLLCWNRCGDQAPDAVTVDGLDGQPWCTLVSFHDTPVHQYSDGTVHATWPIGDAAPADPVVVAGYTTRVDPTPGDHPVFGEHDSVETGPRIYTHASLQDEGATPDLRLRLPPQLGTVAHLLALAKGADIEVIDSFDAHYRVCLLTVAPVPEAAHNRLEQNMPAGVILDIVQPGGLRDAVLDLVGDVRASAAPTVSDAEADLVERFIAKQTPPTIMDGMTREQLKELAQVDEPKPPTLGEWLAQLPLVMAEAEAAGIRIRIDPLPKR